MFDNLQSFIGDLRHRGELHTISTSVTPVLEISAIADRVSKGPCPHPSLAASGFDPAHAGFGGKALLFDNVAGSDFPLAINVFGSYRRMELALGCEEHGFESIARRIASLTKPQPPRSFGELVAKGREFLPLLRTPPRMRRRGRCQEVVRLSSRGEVDLMRLPIIKCWPLDGDPTAVGYEITADQAGTAHGDGRFITFAGMHTIHARDRDSSKPASHNIGMYRAQLVDQTHLVMHWHIHHDGAAHWRSWKEIGEPMPIAIVLGGEPVLPYAATSPLPPGISELLMAGFLNGRGIPLVRAKTVPLRVPANAEIVIEGYVSTECGEIGFDPGSDGRLGAGAAFEGPFGDHTGFYSMPDRYPIVDVTAVTHRRDAVYPTTIVGYPPQEDYYLGKATERIFLPLLQTLIPDIVDYHLPMFGCFHNCAFVKIRKEYALQARRVMHAIWGAGQMAWTKFIIVVDDDVDVHDEQAVLRAVFERSHFGRDLECVNGPLDILDHAAPRLGAGHKLGFDATRKLPGDDVNGIPFDLKVTFRESPTLTRDAVVPGVSRVVVPDFGGGRLALVQVKEMQTEVEGVINSLQRGRADEQILKALELIIVVDEQANVNDWQNVLFHWCANCDPVRDLYGHREDSRIEFDSRIAFDATAKRPTDARCGQPVRHWPPIMEMDDETNSLVDRRWIEYGFSAG